MTASERSDSLAAAKPERPPATLGLWHALVFAAGLTLMITFFLPAFAASGFTPAYLLQREIDDWWYAPDMPTPELFFTFCALVACHLFGALMVLDAAAHLAGRPRLSRALAIPIAGLLALIGAGLLWTAPTGFGQLLRYFGDWWSLPSTLLAGLAVLCYLTWASRFGLEAARLYKFAAAVAAVAYFVYVSCCHGFCRGTYVSLIASGLLLVGIVGATKAASGESWWRTVWKLMTCQVAGGQPVSKVSFDVPRPQRANAASPLPAGSVGIPGV